MMIQGATFLVEVVAGNDRVVLVVYEPFGYVLAYYYLLLLLHRWELQYLGARHQANGPIYMVEWRLSSLMKFIYWWLLFHLIY